MKRPLSLIDRLVGGIRCAALMLVMTNPCGRPNAVFSQPMRGYPVVDMMALQYGSDPVGVAVIRQMQHQVRTYLFELVR